MHTKDAIKFALTVSNQVVLSEIDQMSDAATTFPTPNGGCHPLWVLGHLTLVEGTIPATLGDKNPVEEWQQYFGENSRAVADAGAYPSLAEICSIARTKPEASRVAQRSGSRQAHPGAP